MKVLGIIGDFVEVLWDNSSCGEIEFIPVDEFVLTHGWETLYGKPKRVTEYEDGILYEF